MLGKSDADLFTTTDATDNQGFRPTSIRPTSQNVFRSPGVTYGITVREVRSKDTDGETPAIAPDVGGKRRFMANPFPRCRLSGPYRKLSVLVQNLGILSPPRNTLFPCNFRCLAWKEWSSRRSSVKRRVPFPSLRLHSRRCYAQTSTNLESIPWTRRQISAAPILLWPILP
jgi:hypothetical protein